MAAFQENSLRVNVEFLRATQSGAGRIIRFNHSPAMVPPQLLGRLSPEEWASFMTDVDALAKSHPYVQRPEGKHYAKWAACFALGSVVGFFCVDPDAGDYGAWQAEVAGVIQKNRDMFERAGCLVSLQKGRDYWLQIDVDPNRAPTIPVAAGMPPPVQDGNFMSPFESKKNMQVL